MEPNYSKIFNKETLGSVDSFCKLNNIDDIDGFIKNIFQEGFNIKKYGLLGKTLNEGEKDLKTGGIEEKRVEIEVIREIRVEVPVEVIKEVEKVVTKIEYISDKNGETELLLKIQQLEEEISTKTTEIGTIRKEFSTKTTEMENIFQNEMSKKDNELDELRRNLDINLDINLDNNKVKMLQQTVQNLTGEVRDLKKKNEELNKQMLEKPIESDFTRARFHGSSNLNNDLYR
jgi:predicted RNase H-like nuclease (RuvC/YqgF family)